MVHRFFTLPALTLALASVAQAQQTSLWSESLDIPQQTERWSETHDDTPATERWSESQGFPVQTERWSEQTGFDEQPIDELTPRAQDATDSVSAAIDVRTTYFSALPLIDGENIPGLVEVRSGCDTQFASHIGPEVPIRWYGITETVTLIGRRTNGELCALYTDGSSEWINADRVMSAAEQLAHDQDMQAFGAGLQRQQGGASSSADMLDSLRETSNALHRETQEQYRQTEEYYEDRRRYGQ